MTTRVVLIHGAATTSRIWRNVTPLLSDYKVFTPDRGCSGDLETEIADLAPLCNGALVVGVSGGATLAVELLRRDVGAVAGLAHEPAAGSLAPGLLTHVIEGMRIGGVAGFGSALYGDMWSIDEAPADLNAVSRDLAMFREYEPQGPLSAPLTLTVGELSPHKRYESVTALSALLGTPVKTVKGSSHAAHLEAPHAFAALITELDS